MRLDGSEIIGARFEGVRFVRANVSYTDLTGSDLTGATFRACKFGGAHGKPAATNSVQVIDGDFSVAADGSEPSGIAELLAQLGD